MRKLIAMLMALVMLFGVGAACAEGGEEVLGNVVGGWAVAEGADTAITPELQATFDKAMEGLVGVNYTPLMLLGTQVVAGTNYAFLCQGTVVYPGAGAQWFVVYIYEDLQGNAQVLDIEDIDLEIDYDHDGD